MSEAPNGNQYFPGKVQRCPHCQSVSAVPSRDGNCQYCGNNVHAAPTQPFNPQQHQPAPPPFDPNQHQPQQPQPQQPPQPQYAQPPPQYAPPQQPQPPGAVHYVQPQQPQQPMPQPPAAAPPPPSSDPLLLQYVGLGRDLEGPCRVILDALDGNLVKSDDDKPAAKRKGNGKASAPSEAWHERVEVAQAISQVRLALASPEERQRAKFASAFEQARALFNEGKIDEAQQLLDQHRADD